MARTVSKSSVEAIGKTHSGVSRFFSILKSYGFIWLANFLFALSASVISGGVFGVPSFHVIDVVLSLVLFTAVALMVAYLALAVVNLAMLRIGLGFNFLIYAVIYALLPFAAIIAFRSYDALGIAADSGTSFIYDGFMRTVQAAFGTLGAFLPESMVQAMQLAPDTALSWISGGLAVIALMATAYDARRHNERRFA